MRSHFYGMGCKQDASKAGGEGVEDEATSSKRWAAWKTPAGGRHQMRSHLLQQELWEGVAVRITSAHFLKQGLQQDLCRAGVSADDTILFSIGCKQDSGRVGRQVISHL